MKTRLIASLALAGFAFASAALAAPSDVTGTIRAIDPAQQAITLSNGQVYTLPEGVKADKFKVGDHVKLSWEMEGTVHQVLAIGPAS
ncbi:DUF1344 domain-containing protein [Xinfangfangia pollutisoli]|uniref:DUF1344 domain-containing protein n=1 Tax=Xinfangfangia pollutisoli TaxID=2865960 RepID=UPI001CD3B1C9|nr:DUF1344 domain-containing protein [Xinfangfangia pollutisoli]